MVNVIITSTTNAVKVDFGDYASDLSISKGIWNKNTISKITLNDNHVYLQIKDGNEWILNYSTQDTGMIVDSVDAVVPSNLGDLYQLLSTLLG